MDNNASTAPLLNVAKDETTRLTAASSESDDDVIVRATMSEILSPGFCNRKRWLDELCERLFKIRERQTRIHLEIYYGLIHFVSCLFCLAVIPQQMSQAGYVKKQVFVTTAVCSGIGSIICGLFANLPFVIAPPTAVAIFLSVYLQNYENEIESLPKIGSSSVMFSGFFLMCLGYRPLGNLISRLIPASIQAGTAVGIGLLTALAGAIEIDLVQSGKFNILLQMGGITMKVVIAFSGIVIICVATHYHLKGAFCMAIILCSLAWGVYSGQWPEGVVEMPRAHAYDFQQLKDSHVPLLVVDLLFLYILYLNGLISSLSMIADLARKDGATPRGRWIFILSGIMTVISGYFTGAPVLISPESAAAIKDGAKTGLSTLVCGVLFLLSVFFAPLFDAIPTPGTSPVLLMIGVLLCQNTVRITWNNMPLATPAFIVMFFIPFTYSVIQGVLLGYCVFLLVGLFTGDLYLNCIIFLHIYLSTDWATEYLPEDPRLRSMSMTHEIQSYNFQDFGRDEANLSPHSAANHSIMKDEDAGPGYFASVDPAFHLADHGTRSDSSSLGKVEFVDTLVDARRTHSTDLTGLKGRRPTSSDSHNIHLSVNVENDIGSGSAAPASSGLRRRSQTLSSVQPSYQIDHSMVFIDENLYQRADDRDVRSDDASDSSRRGRRPINTGNNTASSGRYCTSPVEGNNQNRV